jgi:hypothetical protein
MALVGNPARVVHLYYSPMVATTYAQVELLE